MGYVGVQIRIYLSRPMYKGSFILPILTSFCFYPDLSLFRPKIRVKMVYDKHTNIYSINWTEPDRKSSHFISEISNFFTYISCFWLRTGFGS